MYDIEIGYNRIEEYLIDRVYDGGGTYSVGCQDHIFARNKHSRMIGNYYIGQRNVYSSIYLDRGSQYWDCTNNVIDQSDVVVQEKNFDSVYYYNEQKSYSALEQMLGNTGVKQFGFLWGQSSNNSDTVNNVFKDNYAKNAKVVDYYRDVNSDGESNSVEGASFFGYDGNYTEWSQPAIDIMNNAGIEDEYKANFNFTGAKYFVVRQREYKILKGETAKIDMKIKGRNETEFNISDYNVSFYTDSDIVEISPDGTITAKGSGEAWIMVTAVVNGRIQVKSVHVIVE